MRLPVQRAQIYINMHRFLTTNNIFNALCYIQSNVKSNYWYLKDRSLFIIVILFHTAIMQTHLLKLKIIPSP